MKNKKIFVTGADGFIGSHLCELLVKDNYDVTALTLYNSFNTKGWLDTIDKNILKNINCIAGDIRDKEIIKSGMRGSDCVLHLAALIAIPYSYISPKSYIDTNILGTYNLLQAARDLGISRVIHTSTSEVYGSAQSVPIDENHRLEGQSPYAATKISADQIALSFYKSFQLPVAIIRPFNTYGPRQSQRAIIPTIISQINNNKKIVKLGNIKPTRDFSFVSDTAKAFELSINAKNILGEVINIGSNFDISMEDTFNLIVNLMKKEVTLQISKERIRPKKSEVTRLLASNKKAKKLLKWSPKYGGINGFKKGLQETINWFSDSKNLSYFKQTTYVR